MIDINIQVNGEDVRLTDFPREIITNILLAMLRSLKGVENIKDVVIKMEMK